MAGRPVGLPKTGGRIKGKPNRKTTEIESLAKSRGITPLEFMLECLNDKKLTLDFRLDAAAKAAPYVHKRMPQALDVAFVDNHEEALNDLE